MRLQFKLIQAYNNYNDIFSRVRNDFYFLRLFALFLNIHSYFPSQVLRIFIIIIKKSFIYKFVMLCNRVKAYILLVDYRSLILSKIQEKWYLMAFIKWIFLYFDFVSIWNNLCYFFFEMEIFFYKLGILWIVPKWW